MNARRVAELHLQLAELHRELADALVEGDDAADSNAQPAPLPPPPAPAPKKRTRRTGGPLVVAPVVPPDDVTRARARAQLNRLGFRGP
ncbi:uncharacterized protein SOCE836_025850 [Sorangium cellulosum]|uniref:Uncharacterized protein n=1 Tax=Sorangium cellulosum TaxID=56 RepID=A0A4P2QKD4_SORCE|nr:uncharacterized protein SOCE836_025850 [Sorangium cellulosum]WCQ89873.1 hypothetical protein NQZ70_02571 [Sorangium sp. Soce836]